MSDAQHNKCHAIIHTAAGLCAAAGAGMAQIPGSDAAVIVPIQLGMVVSLGAVFGIDLNDSAAKAALASASATTVGRAISQVLLGWLPGIGNALNATTAFAVTETVGWAVANDFAAKTALASPR
jgi:uncharacterized protein (DUF697 family)